MIVSLEEIKAAVDIAEDDTDQDAALTTRILRATAWVESQTHRRFSAPEERTEFRRGTGTDSLYLYGHIDDTIEPSPVVTVSERIVYGIWENLVVNEDYERRSDVLVRLNGPWSLAAEYHIVYPDGYAEWATEDEPPVDTSSAPEDIKALVLELATGQHFADEANISTDGALTSETLVGVYSYTVSASTNGTTGAPGGGGVSQTGRDTLNRWRRKFA